MAELVSIVTPNFNSASFIDRTYSSLYAQTYQNWEWIIVDDASKDNLSNLNKIAATDQRVRVIKLNKNCGAAHARNIGIDEAKGFYIAFLDMDDFWLPNKLEISLSFMELNSRNFVYTNYRKYSIVTKQTSVPIETPSSVSYNDLLKTCSICTSTVVLTRELIKDIRMDTSLRRGQDFLFWLKVLNSSTGAWRCSEECLTLYTVGHESLSSNKFKKALGQWRIYRKYLKLNLLKSFYYFCNYALHGYLKFKKF